MGAGFSVVLAELTTMAGNFRSASSSFRALEPDLSPPVAATGDGGLDGQLKATMTMLSVLAVKMSEALDEHAARLESTRDSYKRHDIDNRFMFDDLMPGQ